ncbi:hypothetical protein LT679_04410 [Mucilaginibacter roseus]|uniref:Uncharacterized protein n=1 Tax=Mucilaginibacter roseus TaxID=1528868 RepID=A0ABS8U181_9SPHI|nr:hypothetical protein [Mucilaginibacter roseus]MCD8739835.1 hypothetical protein [Mucilaginibacter roseus]
MNALTELITLVLAISLAGERLVAFIKTLIPWLAGNPNVNLPSNSKEEAVRKVTVMVIAFGCCWLTAYLVKQNAENDELTNMPDVFLGLLASGGSAFWTTMLGYTKAVRDIRIQQKQQEQVATENVVANTAMLRTENRIAIATDRICRLAPPEFNNNNLVNINGI